MLLNICGTIARQVQAVLDRATSTNAEELTGGRKVTLQEWRCPHCSALITMYAISNGTLMLQRDKCTKCGKGLRPLVVVK